MEVQETSPTVEKWRTRFRNPDPGVERVLTTLRWLLRLVTVGAFVVAWNLSQTPASFELEQSGEIVACHALIGPEIAPMARGVSAPQYFAAEGYVEQMGYPENAAAAKDAMLREVLLGIRTRCLELRQSAMNSVTLCTFVGLAALTISLRSPRRDS